MLNKLRFLIFAAAASFLIYLIYITLVIERGSFDNLLLAAPNNENAAIASVKEIEALNQEKFMLTYEINSQKTVSLELSNKSAVLKKTNYTYPYVMNYNMISGGFFTVSAQEQQSKVAVLNQLAAFNFFGETNILGGTLVIDDASYTVVGVINDQDTENNNVYIPITLSEETPNVYVATLDQGIVIEEYAKNELSKLGISSSNYTFYNLGQTWRIIWDRTAICVIAIGCAVMLLIFKKSLRSFIINLRILQPLYKYNSMFQLFRSYFFEMLKATTSCIFIAASLGSLIWLLTVIADKILSWSTYSSDIGAYSMTPFSNKLALLQEYSYHSGIVYIAFILLLALGTVLSFDTGE